jgi:hypothetical protein
LVEVIKIRFVTIAKAVDMLDSLDRLFFVNRSDSENTRLPMPDRQ